VTVLGDARGKSGGAQARLVDGTALGALEALGATLAVLAGGGVLDDTTFGSSSEVRAP